MSWKKRHADVSPSSLFAITFLPHQLHALKYIYPVQYTCRDARSERLEDVHCLRTFK